MKRQVNHMFRALVLDGVLLAGVLAACGDEAPKEGSEGNQDTDLVEDTDIGEDTDGGEDTDTSEDACPEECLAEDYSITGIGEWAECYPASDVCCWTKGDCCNLCCGNWDGEEPS